MCSGTLSERIRCFVILGELSLPPPVAGGNRLLEMSGEKEFSETCTGGGDIVENFISVELNS